MRKFLWSESACGLCGVCTPQVCDHLLQVLWLAPERMSVGGLTMLNCVCACVCKGLEFIQGVFPPEVVYDDIWITSANNVE